MGSSDICTKLISLCNYRSHNTKCAGWYAHMACGSKNLHALQKSHVPCQYLCKPHITHLICKTSAIFKPLCQPFSSPSVLIKELNILSKQASKQYLLYDHDSSGALSCNESISQGHVWFIMKESIKSLLVRMLHALRSGFCFLLSFTFYLI